MAIQSVAIAGASGNIGQSILNALVSSKRFNVTALVRSDGKSMPDSAGSDFKTVEVDYANSNSLATALKGQDAVICAMNANAAPQQKALLAASVQAGVARFLPSEFGSDTLNPNAAKLPLFASKKAIQAELEGLASRGKISYTYVINGPFLDFGLESGFLGLQLKKRELRFLDGGNAKFSTTTRAGVGQAVVGVLSKAEESKNRAIYVQGASVSLKELYELAKRALGTEGWTEIDAGTSEETERVSLEKLKSGQKDMGVFIGFLLAAIYREGYGGQFSKLDNEVFGVKGMGESEVEGVIQKAAAKSW